MPFETRTGPVFGTVQSQVIESIDGTFDFYWRVTSDTGSFTGINDIRVSSFFAGTGTVGWRSDLGGDVRPFPFNSGYDAAPGKANWLFFPVGDGDGSIEPGQGSYALFIDTDARFYAKTADFQVVTDFVQDKGGSVGESGLYATFAPAVPEPQTYVLMLGGLAVTAWAVRRRRSWSRA
jgi:hypothetical protein